MRFFHILFFFAKQKAQAHMGASSSTPAESSSGSQTAATAQTLPSTTQVLANKASKKNWSESDLIANLGLQFSYLQNNDCASCLSEAEQALQRYRAESQRKESPEDQAEFLQYLERVLAEKQLLMDVCVLKRVLAQQRINNNNNSNTNSLPFLSKLAEGEDCFPSIEALNHLAGNRTVLKSADQLEIFVQVNKCWNRHLQQNRDSFDQFANVYERLALDSAATLFPRYWHLMQQYGNTGSTSSPSSVDTATVDSECELELADFSEKCSKSSSEKQQDDSAAMECYVAMRRMKMCTRSVQCASQIQHCLKEVISLADQKKAVTFASCVEQVKCDAAARPFKQ